MRKLSILVAACTVMLASCVSPAPQAPAMGPAETGRLVAEEYLSRADIMMYDVPPVLAPHYADAAAAYGAAKLGGLIGDEEIVARVAARHQRNPQDIESADLRHTTGYALRLRGVTTVSAEERAKSGAGSAPARRGQR